MRDRSRLLIATIADAFVESNCLISNFCISKAFENSRAAAATEGFTQRGVVHQSQQILSQLTLVSFVEDQASVANDIGNFARIGPDDRRFAGHRFDEHTAKILPPRSCRPRGRSEERRVGKECRSRGAPYL